MIADLERIRAAGRSLLALVSDILDLSRIEAGRAELRPERFDVGQLLDEVAHTIAPSAQEQGNTISVTVDSGTGAMRADRTKVRQVLLNLASNAAKFTQAGQIHLMARRVPDAGDWIELQVIDTGIGIACDRLGELFVPFNQIDWSTTRRHSGTGLGLALADRLCHLMGGTIGVESEPGRGSTFTVRLPGGAHD